MNRGRSAFLSSTTKGADRASSANAVISSGTTALSSAGSSAAHRSATPLSYASTRPGGYDEFDVENGEDAAAAPAAASSGSASPFAAARIIAGIKHPLVRYRRVAGDASSGPARRNAAAAIKVSSSSRNNSGCGILIF